PYVEICAGNTARPLISPPLHSQPVLDRVRQELGERNPVAADDQRARRLERAAERAESGERCRCAAALHLDREHGAAGADDEVALAIRLAPVERLARARGRGVREVRANGRFDEASAELAIVDGVRW